MKRNELEVGQAYLYSSYQDWETYPAVRVVLVSVKSYSDLAEKGEREVVEVDGVSREVPFRRRTRDPLGRTHSTVLVYSSETNGAGTNGFSVVPVSRLKATYADGVAAVEAASARRAAHRAAEAARSEEAAATASDLRSRIEGLVDLGPRSAEARFARDGALVGLLITPSVLASLLTLAESAPAAGTES